MKGERLSTETFDLGRVDADPPAALERLLAEAGSAQGYLIEKTDADGDLSFLGAAPFETLRVSGGKAWRRGRAGRRALPGNPFAALGARLASLRAAGRGRPFALGAVGNLDYELVRYLERLPGRQAGSEGLLMLFDAGVVLDRRTGRAELTALVGRGGRAAAARRAATAANILRACPRREETGPVPQLELKGLKGTLGREGYLRGVRRIREHIRAGDIFQCVLSEGFTVPVRAAPLDVYRRLRRLSPSPYQFFLKDGEDHLIGASPERLVKVVDGAALNCPIAGTRPRGKDPASDARLERALRRSPKEKAEHLMLVDLARNDLGRVCAPGSVKVRSLMEVRRFSHVMHLVSEVEGRLDAGQTAWDALAASFPAGTVSGAPKVRAMQIIAELEPAARGFYAGAVLQSDYAGNLDSCIAIRTLRLSRGMARLQAGAGIVADSHPEREYQEVLDKLAGLRRALAWAGSAR